MFYEALSYKMLLELTHFAVQTDNFRQNSLGISRRAQLQTAINIIFGWLQPFLRGL